jgi:hypothetical protein
VEEAKAAGTSFDALLKIGPDSDEVKQKKNSKCFLNLF